nr:zinc finger BED domain-containing protein RICESLEEPER 2-like [Tanacetum cinerariifolium]
VKDKQEKDKIETKPNKNGKRRKSRQCQSPVTVKKAVKKRKYRFKGPNMQTLEDVLYSRNNTRVDIAIYPKNNYKGRKTESGVAKDSKAELDRYLTEEIEGDEAYFKSGDFTVLGWWKRRSPAFLVLSLVARDILAISISTVASESTISTGGRALDSFRSSLSSETVQALICYRDWVRSFDVAVNLEENIDDLEKFKDATNQKFIFESMVKNLDNVNKFLMYPRVEKDFSGRITPLFPTMLVHNQEEMGRGSTIPTDLQHTPTFIQPSPQPQKTQKHRNPRRNVTEVPQPSKPMKHVTDEAVYKELDDSLVRAASTASSLEAEQDSGNNVKSQSKATPNEPGSQRTSSGVNAPRSDEDRLKLNELMELCTNLQNIVLDLENTKTSQALEIDSLKGGVDSSADEASLGENASKQERKIDDIDADEGITLVDKTAENQRSAAATTATIDDITLTQALVEIKTSKPKAKWIVLQEPSESRTTTTTSSKKLHNKGKGIMVEEHVKLKKKDQILINEEVPKKLQAGINEEERLSGRRA